MKFLYIKKHSENANTSMSVTFDLCGVALTFRQGKESWCQLVAYCCSNRDSSNSDLVYSDSPFNRKKKVYLLDSSSYLCSKNTVILITPILLPAIEVFPCFHQL